MSLATSADAPALAETVGVSTGPGAPERPPSASTWIWWEAEAPRTTNFPDVNPFAPRDPRAASVLSGGKWIGADAPGKVLFAEYDVNAGSASVYQFYARKFWLHGPFRWRFDNQPWRSCGRDIALLDSVELVRFVSATWVNLGAVKLPAGKHTLRIELVETTGPAAFDCFLLTTAPFVARGKLRPGEKVGVAPPGWFAFEPDADPFGPAALDLRSLNEAHAGNGGFIQARGDGFVHADTGRSVRFWAIDAGHALLDHERSDIDRTARFLAKKGVNMVRLHGPLWRDSGSDATVAEVDASKLDRLHYLTRALGQQGIYLALSTYFPLWLRPRGDSPPFQGYDGKQPAFGLAFFSPGFQQIQKGWWRTALTSPNPYTGRPLAADPTLAFVEIVNEDSLFFWTFRPYEGIPAAQTQLLETRFGAWLAKRDGSADRALSRWGGARMRGDDAPAGRVAVLSAPAIAARLDARARDTVEFLAEVQRTYYDDMTRYLKRDLGFKGSVVGSNWVTADARTLGPVDKWSNAGCDFLDRHGYFGGPHEGPRAAFTIAGGDRYDDALALRFEGAKPGVPSYDLPIMDLAYAGKPSTISEIAWVAPNRYRADLPALAAAYGALQGTDAFFFFAGGDPTWASQIDKFTIADPVTLGQFPAGAMIYRQGLVKTGPVVARLTIDRQDLFDRRGLPLAPPQNLDQLRLMGVLPGKPFGGPSRGQVDPLAFLAGRVEVAFTEGPASLANLSGLVDRSARIARSATDELRWDWGRGLVTIDAPSAQGAVGLLAQAGPIALGDLTIASANEYGAVLLVAMDQQPLARSRKMLLQVMTEDANSGWSAPGRGLRPIADPGHAPVVVRAVAGQVTLRDKALRVRALDANGYLASPVAPSPNGAVPLLPTALYYLLER